jgi:hypothetical protein
MSQTLQESAQKLKELCIGTRLGFRRPGQRKAVEEEYQETMNDSVQAEEDGISSTKVLLDRKLPCIKKINKCISRTKNWWMALSWPYPEKGMRLMRKEKVPAFEAGIPSRRDELYELACDVQANYDLIMDHARKKQGKTFNPSNYPADFRQAYALEYGYCDPNPPAALLQIAPEIHRAALQRATAMFEQSVILGENLMAAQLAKFVDALHHALAPSKDGKRTQLRDACLGNFQDFLDAMKSMSLGSNAGLDALLEKAQALIGNASPEMLKKNPDLKAGVVKGLEEIQAILPSLVVAKPRRAITLPTPKVLPAPDAPESPPPFEGPPAVVV